jgi:hypothetical protein
MPHRRLVRSTIRPACIDEAALLHPAQPRRTPRVFRSDQTTMSERNPVSIETGRKKKSTAASAAKAPKSLAKNSAGERGKTPAAARRAGESRGVSKRNAGTKNTRKTKNSTKSTTSKSETAASGTASAKASDHAPATNATPRLPENRHPGLHERSYAAHLEVGPQEPHTKPAGDLRFTAFPAGRKQP